MHDRIEPFAHGHLVRPDGAELYWETSGNPDGKPAIYLHGGPGGSLGARGYRRRFDPERHLIVGLDQRGCGLSRPWAIDDLEHVDRNTTATLIEDIEALRVHLGIRSWLVHGVSWGSTLALAYALEHPERVSEIVLMAVTSSSREEIDWIAERVGAVFPEAWERFAAAARPGERVVDAYARLMRDPDADTRAAAAEAWDEWESTHISLDPNWRPGPLYPTARERQNFALLVSRYWANDGFLGGDRRILDRIGELAGIPGVLIHGRQDISGPAVTAWRLHRAWPGSRLEIFESEGHGGPLMSEAAMRAIDGFADRAAAPASASPAP